MDKTVNAVLAGNPNCGKSTIFNKLTGARQTIGNFPGVTVERYQGQAHYKEHQITIVDLPGVYSLSTYSDEERVAAEYLKNEKPEVIINIIDASNLERNLYLTLLLKDLHRPMIVVLNMIDVARRRGIEISEKALSRELGIPVLTTIGNRGIGLNDILDEIIRMVDIKRISESEQDTGMTPDSLSKDGLSIDELPEDRRMENQPADETLSGKSSGESREKKLNCCSSCVHGGKCQQCPSQLAWQTALDIARYKEINRVCIHCVRSVIPLEQNWSDRADRLLTNKYLGIPIFLAAMYLVFQLTFTIGQYPMDWMEKGFALLSELIAANWPKGQWEFMKSLLVDGIIGGVGGVLVFLPNILILFLAISILEDSGYLARAALLSDRWMHKIGLHGKSIVPMLIGFGCTVPALMSARMLSNRRERLTTMFVLPLFSCGARFPIYALLIPAFFPLYWRGPMLWLIYFIGIILAIIFAKMMSLFFKKNDVASFIIELPPYHFPTFRTVGLRTIERGIQYMKKAGTIILGISVILWFLTNYPGLSPEQTEEFEARREIALTINQSDLPDIMTQMDNEEKQLLLSGSFAGRLGRLLEPVFKPMGFDWKIGTALIGAVAAKEVFVAQMGIVYPVGNIEENTTENSFDENATEITNETAHADITENAIKEQGGLADILAKNYSPMTGFCVMLFCLISSPCMATFVTMAKESGSWKWAFAQWGGLTVIAWLVTTAVWQVGSFFIG